MTKPQHEQDYEVVLTADLDPSQLASLDRLHAEAAKVPGLEADNAALLGALLSSLEVPVTHELRTYVRSKFEAEPHPGAALLERLAKAESERDATRQEVAALKSNPDTNGEHLQTSYRQIAEVAKLLDPEVCPDAWGLHAAAEKVVAERGTLRERVATLERQVEELKEELAEMKSEARSLNEMHDTAEARVKELEAQVAGARNAALEEAAEVAVSAPSSDHAHRRILHLKSQPPSAPAQGVDEDVATVRDALDVFYQRSEANYSKDRARWNSAVDALERLASRPATPTTPALVEAVGPFIELGDRVADTVALKDPNAVVAHICDDGCHYREVKVRDFQRLRAAYDAAKGGGK